MELRRIRHGILTLQKILGEGAGGIKKIRTATALLKRRTGPGARVRRQSAATRLRPLAPRPLPIAHSSCRIADFFEAVGPVFYAAVKKISATGRARPAPPVRTRVRRAVAASFALMMFLTLIAQGASATLLQDVLVGVIVSGDRPFYDAIHAAFTRRLSERGVRAAFIVQRPGNDPLARRNAARKLIALDVAAVVCYGAPAALAVMAEKARMPVLFAGVHHPEAIGLKGKNVTGIRSHVPLFGPLENLNAIHPVEKLGITFNGADRDSAVEAGQVETLMKDYGYVPYFIDMNERNVLERLDQLDALYIAGGCDSMTCLDEIVHSARAARIPTATTVGGAAQRGVIVTVAAAADEQGEVAASMLARIVNGERPSSIPVVEPRKVEFVLNLREAQNIGVTIPLKLLMSATEVIR